MRSLCLVLLAFSCLTTLAAEQLKCPPQITHIFMPQGEYSPQPGTVFALHDFQADMVARGKSSPLCFTRWTDIKKGEVFVSSQSLSNMFERKLRQSDRAVSEVKVELKDDKARISGKMKKAVPIPFSIEGPVTTDGRNLDLQAKSIKAVGIPMKGLLDALGKHLGSLVQSESMSGISASGDTLIFRPEQISHVRGHIASVQLTDKGLVVKFDQQPASKTANARNPSHSHPAAVVSPKEKRRS